MTYSKSQITKQNNHKMLIIGDQYDSSEEINEIDSLDRMEVTVIVLNDLSHEG